MDRMTNGGRIMKCSTSLLLSLCCATTVFSDIWIVDIRGKGDFVSIQSAINASSNGDTIVVHEGEYFESINYLGKSITVEGVDRDNTIINGSKTVSAVVTFDSDEDNSSVLQTFSIIRGSGNYWDDPVFGSQLCGGGIFCEGSSPLIHNCIVTDNRAWGGGGIFSTEGSISMTNCEIRRNTALGHGGGLYLVNKIYGTIATCNIVNNIASWGGGVTCSTQSDPIITNCNFNDNTTNNVGGGIFIRSYSNPVLSHCDFNDNIQITNPLGSGGGACIYGGGETGGVCYPTFQECFFKGNSVQGDGGGMAAAYDAHPKLIACVFTENSAGRSGGGLACVADVDHDYSSNADVSDSFFESNQAAEEGGGIHVRHSAPLLAGIYVSMNTANIDGGGINFYDSSFARLSDSTICNNSLSQVIGVYEDFDGNSIHEVCVQCDGDVTNDGWIDITDLLEVVSSWGPCLDLCPADLDNNGIVDITDLLIIVGNWGSCDAND